MTLLETSCEPPRNLLETSDESRGVDFQAKGTAWKPQSNFRKALLRNRDSQKKPRAACRMQRSHGIAG